MNKKKSKNKKQDKQSEKPVPRKKEEEQTEGTGRNSAQNPCYGLLVCTGISYIYCLDFKNKKGFCPTWDKSLCFCDTTQIDICENVHSLTRTIIRAPMDNGWGPVSPY